MLVLGEDMTRLLTTKENDGSYMKGLMAVEGDKLMDYLQKPIPKEKGPQ